MGTEMEMELDITTDFKSESGGDTAMKKKNRNARFGRYPSCDLCNNALRFILKGDSEEAFKEIVRAIQEADGYFHDDIADIVQKIRRDRSEF